MRRLFAITTIMMCAMCLAQAQTDMPQPGGRGRRGFQQPQTAPPAGQGQGQGGQQRALPPLEEKKSVTQGSVRIAGQEIKYTATAANYIVKAADGTPKASFFFVGYTKDDVTDKSKRPVSFIYNGGPGSASSYTHMGMGPKRIALTDDG
ncbi:MAG TPA: hypothetical protein VFY40_16545, partial [Blastocatellia bacterium]|nr:hypothetical protein [Blastocatellia bacterium]